MFPEDRYAVFRGSDGEAIVDERMREFCASRTIAEAEKELNAHHITAIGVNTYAQMIEHPHVIARENIIEWDGIEGEKVKGLSIAPRLKNYPAEIWRRPAHYGEDNEDVLAELGYTPEQISALYDQNILRQDMTK